MIASQDTPVSLSSEREIEASKEGRVGSGCGVRGFRLKFAGFECECRGCPYRG